MFVGVKVSKTYCICDGFTKLCMCSHSDQINHPYAKRFKNNTSFSSSISNTLLSFGLNFQYLIDHWGYEVASFDLYFKEDRWMPSFVLLKIFSMALLIPISTCGGRHIFMFVRSRLPRGCSFRSLFESKTFGDGFYNIWKSGLSSRWCGITTTRRSESYLGFYLFLFLKPILFEIHRSGRPKALIP